MKKILFLRKGKDDNDHPFSAFGGIVDKADIWLENYLQDNDVVEVTVVGLATDFCVKETALDAVKAGFKTTLVKDACAGIAEDLTFVYDELEEQNVKII